MIKKYSTPFPLDYPLFALEIYRWGGTGKSPMVEFLTAKLKDRFSIALLSRGYKRKTKGYTLAREGTDALEIGDEPMQFHLKFPEVAVAVGEKRIEAIPQLLHDKPATQVIILDDAFQHRAIKAGLNILLTEYGNLFTRDFYLPTGDLRDLKRNYKKADIIIVTKCKPGLQEDEKNNIKKEIKLLPGQEIYFTALEYGRPYHIITKSGIEPDQSKEVLLVSGIANPVPLKKFLEEHTKSYQFMQFPDHHIFSIDELNDIKKRFEGIENKSKFILTTEKDAVRLLKFQHGISELPLYVIPIRHHFLFNEEGRFIQSVSGFIQNFTKQL